MPDSFVSDAGINTIESGIRLFVYTCIRLQYCEKKIVKTHFAVDILSDPVAHVRKFP